MASQDNRGNAELKLAMNHLRLWFAHNGFNTDGLEIAIRVTHAHDSHQMERVFRTNMEPGDAPNFVQGMHLQFESENGLLAHIGKQDIKIQKLEAEIHNLLQKIQ